MERCDRRATGLLIALAACLLPTLASAQVGGNFARPTQAQLELYMEGKKAFQDEDFSKAIDHFRASLMVGDMNITWLNLGRAFFKDGRCVEAREAFDKVAASPQVQDPSPVEVLAKLEEYRQELKTSCMGSLVVACAQQGVKISVDGGAARDCDGAAIELVAGPHAIIGHLGADTRRLDVEVVAFERVEVALEIAAGEVASEGGGREDGAQGKGEGSGSLEVVGTGFEGRGEVDEPDPSSTLRTLGFVQLGIAGVCLAAGVGFFFKAGGSFEEAERLAAEGQDRAAFEAAVEDVESQTSASNLFYTLSAIMGLSGSIFLFALDDSEAEPRAGGSLRLILSPAGVGLSGAF